MKKLPIGIQSIRQILAENQLYVDKTQFALNLIQNGKHYFILRPRRFGKSLFINTLKQIFLGNKKLFKGLDIYNSDYDWKEYSVLIFDFAQIACDSVEELNAGLKAELERMGKAFGISVEGPSVQFQLKVLVKALAKKRPVVILVDEYDSPIINNLEDPETAEKNRKLLKNFFGTLKGLDDREIA